MFAIVKQIVDAGAQFRSLTEPWTDTGTRTGRLMIAVLGGLADVERDLIRTRTAEGRSRAKARGQHMGRPSKLTPQQQAEAQRRRAEGTTLKELTKSYNMGVELIVDEFAASSVHLPRSRHWVALRMASPLTSKVGPNFRSRLPCGFALGPEGQLLAIAVKDCEHLARPIRIEEAAEGSVGVG